MKGLSLTCILLGLIALAASLPMHPGGWHPAWDPQQQQPQQYPSSSSIRRPYAAMPYPSSHGPYAQYHPPHHNMPAFVPAQVVYHSPHNTALEQPAYVPVNINVPTSYGTVFYPNVHNGQHNYHHEAMIAQFGGLSMGPTPIPAHVGPLHPRFQPPPVFLDVPQPGYFYQGQQGMPPLPIPTYHIPHPSGEALSQMRPLEGEGSCSSGGSRSHTTDPLIEFSNLWHQKFPYPNLHSPQDLADGVVRILAHLGQKRLLAHVMNQVVKPGIAPEVLIEVHRRLFPLWRRYQIIRSDRQVRSGSRSQREAAAEQAIVEIDRTTNAIRNLQAPESDSSNVALDFNNFLTLNQKHIGTIGIDKKLKRAIWHFAEKVDLERDYPDFLSKADLLSELNEWLKVVRPDIPHEKLKVYIDLGKRLDRFEGRYEGSAQGDEEKYVSDQESSTDQA